MKIQYFREIKEENKENIKEEMQNTEKSNYTITNSTTNKKISKEVKNKETNNNSKFLQSSINYLEEENFNYIIKNGEQFNEKIDLNQISKINDNNSNESSDKIRAHIFQINSIFKCLEISEITDNIIYKDDLIRKIENALNIINNKTLIEKSLSDIYGLLDKEVCLNDKKNELELFDLEYFNLNKINPIEENKEKISNISFSCNTSDKKEEIKFISQKRKRQGEETKENKKSKMGRKPKNSGEKGNKDHNDPNNGLHKMLHRSLRIVYDISNKLAKEIDENIKLFYPGINKKDLINTNIKQNYLDKTIKNILCEYISKDSKKDEFKKNKAIIEKTIPNINGKEEKKELFNEMISKPFRYYFSNYVNNIKIMEKFITFDEDDHFRNYDQNKKNEFKEKGRCLVNNDIKVRKPRKNV